MGRRPAPARGDKPQASNFGKATPGSPHGAGERFGVSLSGKEKAAGIEHTAYSWCQGARV